ncbi:MAG: ATP-grasp domain-containing protein [Flavobacteriales bacterium]
MLVGSNHLLIERARLEGLHVYLVHKDRSVIESNALLVGDSLLTDYEDRRNWDEIVRFAGQHGIERCLSLSEGALLCSRYVDDRLTGGDLLRISALTKNKYRLRSALSDAYPYTIPWMVPESINDIHAFVEDHETAVIKPVDGVGSREVRYIGRGFAEHAVSGCLTGGYLLEKKIDGREFSVEAIVHGGTRRVIGITEKSLYEGTFVEKSHIVPASLPSRSKETLEAACLEFLELIGARQGVYHIEFILESSTGKPCLVEAHDRVGGDWIPELWYFITDIDLYREYILSSTNKNYALPKVIYNSKICGIFFFDIEKPKFINIGYYKLMGIEGVVCVQKNKKGPITSVGKSSDRPGFFIVKTDSRERLEESVRQAYSSIAPAAIAPVPLPDNNQRAS